MQVWIFLLSSFFCFSRRRWAVSAWEVESYWRKSVEKMRNGVGRSEPELPLFVNWQAGIFIILIILYSQSCS